MRLNPVFNDLNNPDTILNHVEQLKGKSEATPHAEILSKLINQFEPLDFEALANPENSEHFKLNTKHRLILSIENILKLADQKQWGICKNHEFIYLYNGTFWAEIDKETFQKFLGEAAEQMGIGKYDARYYQFREQLFKQFLSTAYLPNPENGKNTVLINLLNGTFEISPQGTKLRPFDRSDFITYQLPFEYTPQAKAPLFEAFLNRVLPDPERQRVLAEYLGYIFIKHGGGLKLQAAMILYGTGANGKSVFFEIVNALLGNNNVSSYSLQELTDDSGYYRAMIANKLLNYASEITGKLQTDNFKKMVSGEMVTARLPYGKPMELTKYAKFIFNCNELPKEVEHTNAFFRRWLIIPFDVTIPKDEQDSELHTKIIEKELSGVFNWVLEGLNRLLEQKRFSECKAAQQALDQYEIESNSVQMFLNENEYESSPNNHRLLKELYFEYRSFCNEDGMPPFKKSNFKKQLMALGIIVERVSQNQLAVFINGPGHKDQGIPF
jgi:putative DNA primase/helicase